jgi:DNA-directed RNA polymerase specialized sigma24 family protein
MNTDFDWEQLLKTDRPEGVLQRFWNKYDSEITRFLEFKLIKYIPKADADFDDVTQEVKICLFKALKNNRYNSKKATFKGFAAMVLSRKRVDFIRQKVRNQNKLNKLFNSSKTRNGDDFSVINNAMFNEYLDKWQILKNQLPEQTKLILADLGQYTPKEVMDKYKLNNLQMHRLKKTVEKLIEGTIFSGSKF